MAANPELVGFVKEALARGLTRVEIESTLAAAGWNVEQVRVAMGAWADLGCPVPVPRPQPSLSAREAFMYLLQFTTLCVVAFSIGNILAHLIDWALPDPSTHSRPAALATRIRPSLAAFIAAGPVFILMARSIAAATRRDPVARLSPVRRWLTYLTLFLAACVLLGDATSLIYELLGGELALRFALKAGVVGSIAGVIFTFYLKDLRADEGASDGR